MATKKLQVLANLGPTDAKIKSTVEEYFVSHPIDTTLIDKLTPAFEASGPIVICNPVEGYPLDVRWETKNLAEADSDRTVDVGGGIVVTATKGSAEIVVNGTATKNQSMALFYSIALPAGTYTVSVNGLNAGDYLLGTGTSGQTGQVFSGYGVQAKTFTVNQLTSLKIECIFISGSAYSNTPVRIQIEKGSIATPYEPYNDGTSVTLTRCGKNLFGGDAMADTMVSFGANKDEEAGTIWFRPGALSNSSGSLFRLDVSKIYTIILYGINETSIFTNVRISYVDGTYEMLRFPVKGEAGYSRFVTTTSKPATSFGFIHASGDTTLHYDKCGIFEGDVSLEEFESYEGDTFTLGEQIPALPGVNALYANGGLLTVAGRLDPTYAYDAILKKVAAIEAAAVSTIPE